MTFYSLSTIEIQQKSLYSKQSRSYQFKNKRERDQFLKNEIQSINNTINIQTKQVTINLNYIKK